MIPYTGWGCPTCEIGNPATRKRCKKCGRKRPDKFELKTFHRSPRVNKPKRRSTVMPQVLKKVYSGTTSGRLSSKGIGPQNVPRTEKPIEAKLSARFSDGAYAALQQDGKTTCDCPEFISTKTCRHQKALDGFIADSPALAGRV